MRRNRSPGPKRYKNIGRRILNFVKIFSSNVKKVVYKLFALCYNYSIKTNKATLMNRDTEAFDMDSITSQWYWRSVRQANRQANRQVKPRCEVVSIKTAVDTVTTKNNVVPFVRKVAKEIDAGVSTGMTLAS